MDERSYEEFTQTLLERLAGEESVLGLVALGSMAEPTQRDQWSDHDFWIITQSGAQERFLDDLAWLPNAYDIILPFRQGAQYYTVLYRNGHSIEFAIFDRVQMQQGKTERYRVLFDKANIAADMQQIHAQTLTSVRAEQSDVSDTILLNYFFLQLLVGVQRYLRGEFLSSQKSIFFSAVNNLLSLVQRYLAPQNPAMGDPFDIRRRFEQVYPSFAEELHTCLGLACPAAALGLLVLVDKQLAPVVPHYPQQLADVTRESIEHLIQQTHGTSSNKRDDHG
ncbi:MAG: aminoglycoside 6-adenylyltransferase [Caldilineaceae bacterium]